MSEQKTSGSGSAAAARLQIEAEYKDKGPQWHRFYKVIGNNNCDCTENWLQTGRMIVAQFDSPRIRNGCGVYTFPQLLGAPISTKMWWVRKRLLQMPPPPTPVQRRALRVCVCIVCQCCCCCSCCFNSQALAKNKNPWKRMYKQNSTNTHTRTPAALYFAFSIERVCVWVRACVLACIWHIYACYSAIPFPKNAFLWLSIERLSYSANSRLAKSNWRRFLGSSLCLWLPSPKNKIQFVEGWQCSPLKNSSNARTHTHTRSRWAGERGSRTQGHKGHASGFLSLALGCFWLPVGIGVGILSLPLLLSSSTSTRSL